jgi:uncharacterized membrane protein YeiH
VVVVVVVVVGGGGGVVKYVQQAERTYTHRKSVYRENMVLGGQIAMKRNSGRMI